MSENQVKTERLLLKPVCNDDMPLFEKLLSCSNTTQFLPGGKPYGLSRIHQYVENRMQHWQQYSFGTFTVHLMEDSDSKIGYAGVEWVAENPNYADIRYAILPDATGKGYAFEAAAAVLKHTFASTSLADIYGVAVAENVASIHLLKKLGMRPEPELNIYHSDGLLTFKHTRHSKCYSG